MEILNIFTDIIINLSAESFRSAAEALKVNTQEWHQK